MPHSSEQQGFIPEDAREREHRFSSTPEAMQKGAERVVDMATKSFQVDGQERIEALRQGRQENPDQRFVITGSHLSNLDVPAAVKVLGRDFNMQVAPESVLFGLTAQQIVMNIAGRENFTPLEYKKRKGGGKMGVFNPDNFDALGETMEEGRTPWIAIHPMTTDGKMKHARVGPVFLAQKTGSRVIPTALEVRGGSISFEGIAELAKGFAKKVDATYHVGSPIELEPVDIAPLEDVLRKRERGEKITKEELAAFKETHRRLQEQADRIGEAIAAMLPEEQRGVYAKEEATDENVK